MSPASFPDRTSTCEAAPNPAEQRLCFSRDSCHQLAGGHYVMDQPRRLAGDHEVPGCQRCLQRRTNLLRGESPVLLALRPPVEQRIPNRTYQGPGPAKTEHVVEKLAGRGLATQRVEDHVL